MVHEHIYDAALKDDVFEALPGRLAKALDGRSAVIHWHGKGMVGEIVHSGHFSEDHMAMLDARFDGHDLWASALGASGARNRAWNCDSLVPERLFESGRLFNEWIRPIGDDTFHGLGAVFDAGSVVGEIGIHRARRQGAFAEEQRQRLEALLPALRQMVIIRQRLTHAQGLVATSAAALDACGLTVLIVNAKGGLIHANQAGEDLLASGDAMRVRNGKLSGSDHRGDTALGQALDMVTGLGTGQTVAMTGRSGRRYGLTLNPILANGTRQVVILVHGHSQGDSDRAVRASVMFGLTVTEAKVASLIAEGRSAKDIAQIRGISVLTVRDQIKSIMQKMGVHRQSEIAAVLGSR